MTAIEHGDAPGCEALREQSAPDYFHGFFDGVCGFVLGIEHAGAAGLEAQCERIEGHIGAVFENYADYSEWDRYPADEHAVGSFRRCKLHTYGGGQCGNLPDSRHDVGYPRAVEPQASATGSGAVHGLAVGRIGGDDFICGCLHGICHGNKCVVDFFGRCGSESVGGSPACGQGVMHYVGHVMYGTYLERIVWAWRLSINDC